MNAEFNWWLLIVGVVGGAGLAWLVLADLARRDRDIAEDEVPAEAAWIARTLAGRGSPVSPEDAEAVLRAHRTYLGFPPPDALVEPDELRPVEPGPSAVPTAAAADATSAATVPWGPSGTAPRPERPGPADPGA